VNAGRMIKEHPPEKRSVPETPQFPKLSGKNNPRMMKIIPKETKIILEFNAEFFLN
jgi:hypothetical protein